MTQIQVDVDSPAVLIGQLHPEVTHFDLDLKLESLKARRYSDIESCTDRRGFRRLPTHNAQFQFDCLFTDQCNGQIDLHKEVSDAIESKTAEISGMKRCGGTVQPPNSRPEFRCDCMLSYNIHIEFT